MSVARKVKEAINEYWNGGNKRDLAVMRENLVRETKLLQEAVAKARRQRKEEFGT